MPIPIVTYHSTNAIPSKAWTAHVVLPNGEYWGVRFEGASEEAVKAKAQSFWNNERAKFSSDPVKWIKEPKVEPDPWADIAPKLNWTWMRHKETRKLIKVVLTEIVMHEKNGYERSSPRSK